MTGLEYTNRLIDDINIIIKTDTQVQEPLSELTKYDLEDKVNFVDFTKSLNNSEAKMHLDNLSEFINRDNNILVSHNKGELIDLNVWKRDIIENKLKIADLFQQIIDNPNLSLHFENKKTSVLLIEILDSIHNSINKPLY